MQNNEKDKVMNPTFYPCNEFNVDFHKFSAKYSKIKALLKGFVLQRFCVRITRKKRILFNELFLRIMVENLF